MTSPAETLVAAADLIRDLAADTSKGEWLSNLHYVDSMPELYVRHPVCTAAGEGDARWIAALSPALADDLSALLVALDGREFDAARVIALRLSARVLGEETP